MNNTKQRYVNNMYNNKYLNKNKLTNNYPKKTQTHASKKPNYCTNGHIKTIARYYSFYACYSELFVFRN